MAPLRSLIDQAAARAAGRLGDKGAEGAHLGDLGLACADLGEVRKAIEYYEQALAIAREMGNQEGEGAHLGHLEVGCTWSGLTVSGGVGGVGQAGATHLGGVG